MYGSDEEYLTRPHDYKPCVCAKLTPHCWWCGAIEANPIHSQVKENHER